MQHRSDVSIVVLLYCKVTTTSTNEEAEAAAATLKANIYTYAELDNCQGCAQQDRTMGAHFNPSCHKALCETKLEHCILPSYFAVSFLVPMQPSNFQGARS